MTTAYLKFKSQNIHKVQPDDKPLRWGSEATVARLHSVPVTAPTGTAEPLTAWPEGDELIRSLFRCLGASLGAGAVVLDDRGRQLAADIDAAHAGGQGRCLMAALLAFAAHVVEILPESGVDRQRPASKAGDAGDQDPVLAAPAVPRAPAGPQAAGQIVSLPMARTGLANLPTASPAPLMAVAAADPPAIRAAVQALAVEPMLVTSAEEWTRALPELLAAPLIGLDLETTGLDPLSSRVRLAQLATPGRTLLLDCFAVAAAALQPVLDGARRISGHNLKFDLRQLMSAGVRLPADVGGRLADTMLASQLLAAGDRSLSHGLGEVGKRFLGVELDKSAQRSDWSAALSREQLRYAALDAAVLLPLMERLEQQLEAAGLAAVAGIEYGALPALAWLEQSGVLIDAERWRRLATAAEARLQAVEAGLDRQVGRRLAATPLGLEVERAACGWSSREQVLELLKERGLELPDLRRETIAEHLDRDPLLPLLLEHSELIGRTTTFGERFLDRVHPRTGRLHGDFHQLGADSGRIACRKPNVQNIPREAAYRACFRAPEGRLLVKTDFSQIELRIAAELAPDERMVAAYAAGEDLHALTARLVLGRSEVSKSDRQASKALNFGLAYGMGAPSLRARALADFGVELSPEEAKCFRARFFETYRGLRAWHRRQPEGEVETRTLAARRRLGVSRFTEKLNTPVQGTGADGLKLALGALFETRQRLPSARPVLTVHDEIVVECDAQDAEAVRDWLESSMRGGMGSLLQRVPVEVESQIGRDWAGSAVDSESADG